MHRMLKNTKIHLSLVGVFVQSDMIYTFLHSKCSVRNFKSVAFKLMAKWWSILMFGGGGFSIFLWRTCNISNSQSTIEFKVCVKQY